MIEEIKLFLVAPPSYRSYRSFLKQANYDKKPFVIGTKDS